MNTPVDTMTVTNAEHEGRSADGQWVEISVALGQHLQESLANYLIELGADGVVTDEEVAAPPTAPSLLRTEPIRRVIAYLKNDHAIRAHIDSLHRYLAALADIHALKVAPQVELALVRDEDWSTQWQQHFSTCRIGRRMVIRPSWERYAHHADDVVITMDPGMAFGTGTHPTTRMCLEVIEDVVSRSSPPIRSMIDVGTGSGILGIAAAKLGIEHVVGIDIDPIAAGYAIKNASINGVSHLVQIRDCPLERIGEQFDLITANILSEILLKLRRKLQRRLSGGGILVLSGILAEDAHTLENAFLSNRHRLVNTFFQEEWACLVLQKQLA